MYSSFLVYFSQGSKGDALKHLLVCAGAIVFIYGLSFLLSSLSNSPFTSGKGPYDTSSLWSNIFKNLDFYLNGSDGFRLLIIVFALMPIGLGVFARREKEGKYLALRLLFLLGCSIALMGPYLVLPRQIEIYAMNFVPILAFSVVPVMFVGVVALFEKRIPVETHCVIALILAMGTIFLFSTLDKSPRNSNHKWMAHVRSRSAIQLDEVVRSLDFGLKECNIVRVTGISSEFGPFLNYSAHYLNKKINSSLAWQIEVVPETLLAGFSKRHPIKTEKWSFVSENEASVESRCILKFNPKTLRASLFRNTPIK